MMVEVMLAKPSAPRPVAIRLRSLAEAIGAVVVVVVAAMIVVAMVVMAMVLAELAVLIVRGVFWAARRRYLRYASS
jgi:hypothetical protein